MNAPIVFDTLAFAKRLSASGMDVRQAEAIAEALNEVVFDVIATKADVNFVRTDIKALELRLKHDLTVRLGAAIAGSTALTIAALGALFSLR